MSERRACRVIDADRKSVRYRSRRPPETELRARLRDLANERRRFGYNTCRPHSSIGYQTPADYAETIFAMGSGMPDPIANKAPKGITTTAAAQIRAG